MTSAVLKCCPVDVTVNRSLSTGKLHRVELLLQTKLALGTLDVLLSKSFLCARAVGVSNMIAKLAKTCTLRISPDKLNFILSDKLASGGVSMWCELEQENFFSEFQMEGISAANNEIYLELTSENLSRALKTAQNARALKIKLTNKHYPCLTVSIELLSVSSSSRIVTHDIPVKVIPRRLWKDLQEPTVPDSDVSIYLPVLKTMKSVVEKMKNISNHLIIEANLNGELNLKIETELVCVTTHFKDLGNPPLASENASQARNPEQMAEVHIDIRKLLQFLAGQQANPTKAVCRDLGGGQLADCSGCDGQTLGKSSVPRSRVSAKGISRDWERCVWMACSPSLKSTASVRAEENGGLRLCSQSLSPPHEGVRVEVRVDHARFVSDWTLSCPPGIATGTEDDVEVENPTSSASWGKVFLSASTSMSGKSSFSSQNSAHTCPAQCRKASRVLQWWIRHGFLLRVLCQ
ncbi:checkpoint protein HUS1 isoform X1 [Equus caballus]|uniref:checkpoint protein HUS1 isoform X1 n=1 Tax=Equus caballus TaxID=9796 RepID=UPI0038B385A5